MSERVSVREVRGKVRKMAIRVRDEGVGAREVLDGLVVMRRVGGEGEGGGVGDCRRRGMSSQQPVVCLVLLELK